MIDKNKIIEVAETYINTPYHHQGRLKNVGIDCAGLVIEVSKELNIYQDGSDYFNYTMRPDGITLYNNLLKYCNRKSMENLENGDVILMKFLNNPQHLAIYNKNEDGEFIIHSYMKVKKCVKQRFDSFWKEKVVAVFEYKDKEEELI